MEPLEVLIGYTGHVFQYMPVRSVMKNVLQQKNVKEMIISAQSSTPAHCDSKVFRDFRDGSIYRNLVPNTAVATICILHR